MVKIAVLASFNMDLVMRAERRPQDGETLQGEFAMFLGGKGFNQAIAARRLGAEVVVAGRVGDDEFGRRFLDALDREGIDRRAVVVDTEAGTGVASIIVEPDGTNTILQAPRANRQVLANDIERAAEAWAGTSMGMLQLETSAQGAIAFARAMRGAGSGTLLNPAPAAPVDPELLALIDVIVPNQIEAEALTGRKVRSHEEAFEAVRALRDLGPSAAVITLGERALSGSPLRRWGRGRRSMLRWSTPWAPATRSARRWRCGWRRGHRWLIRCGSRTPRERSRARSTAPSRRCRGAMR